jgi:hypothetical protein
MTDIDAQPTHIGDQLVAEMRAGNVGLRLEPSGEAPVVIVSVAGVDLAEWTCAFCSRKPNDTEVVCLRGAVFWTCHAASPGPPRRYTSHHGTPSHLVTTPEHLTAAGLTRVEHAAPPGASWFRAGAPAPRWRRTLILSRPCAGAHTREARTIPMSDLMMFGEANNAPDTLEMASATRR